LRPSPYVVESIERDGQPVYGHEQSPTKIESVDRAAFYQLKTMMQGVVARGTARSIAALSPYVAGKTGTTDDENDAWFVGFTNDVTVAVWLGYDNSDGKRRTLGSGSTGGGLAVPIFESVIQSVWANVAPRTALAPPSPEAKRQLACKSVDSESGEALARGRSAITECFRLDGKGRILDTQYRLVSREQREERVVKRAERSNGYQESRRDYRSHDQWQGSQWGSNWDYERRWRDDRRAAPTDYWGGARYR
jgi:penicillin-binding protein 1A